MRNACRIDRLDAVAVQDGGGVDNAVSTLTNSVIQVAGQTLPVLNTEK